MHGKTLRFDKTSAPFPKFASFRGPSFAGISGSIFRRAGALFSKEI
jgi:hypothetical protein